MKNTIRKAVGIFRAEPLNFSLLIIMGVLAAVAGNYLAALLFAILIATEVRTVLLKVQVRVLGVVAGAAVFAAAAEGGLFNE